MRAALRNAAFWLPAWILVSLPVGAVRGWCPASGHWTACVAGSMSYTALGFAAGYWVARPFLHHPAARAAGGIAGVAAFYAFTEIGR